MYVAIERMFGFSAKETEKHKRADFPFFAAILVPDAAPEKFRCVCDWLNWVFRVADT